jgi:hypothetical protein
MTSVSAVPTPQRAPLWLKVAYTAFMMVLVPVYWLWVAGMMVGAPFLLFLPVHLLLWRYAPKPA